MSPRLFPAMPPCSLHFFVNCKQGLIWKGINRMMIGGALKICAFSILILFFTFILKYESCIKLLKKFNNYCDCWGPFSRRPMKQKRDIGDWALLFPDQEHPTNLHLYITYISVLYSFYVIFHFILTPPPSIDAGCSEGGDIEGLLLRHRDRHLQGGGAMGAGQQGRPSQGDRGCHALASHVQTGT